MGVKKFRCQIVEKNVGASACKKILGVKLV